MFAVVFICGNLFLRIAGKIAKIANIRTRKISCHTVCTCTALTATNLDRNARAWVLLFLIIKDRSSRAAYENSSLRCFFLSIIDPILSGHV